MLFSRDGEIAASKTRKVTPEVPDSRLSLWVWTFAGRPIRTLKGSMASRAGWCLFVRGLSVGKNPSHSAVILLHVAGVPVSATTCPCRLGPVEQYGIVAACDDANLPIDSWRKSAPPCTDEPTPIIHRSTPFLLSPHLLGRFDFLGAGSRNRCVRLCEGRDGAGTYPRPIAAGGEGRKDRACRRLRTVKC